MDAHTGSSEPTCNRSLARREALEADHTTTGREGRARPCRERQRMSSEPGLGHRPSCFSSALMLCGRIQGIKSDTCILAPREVESTTDILEN